MIIYIYFFAGGYLAFLSLFSCRVNHLNLSMHLVTLCYSEFGEFSDALYFRYAEETRRRYRDLINTETSTDQRWNYNYQLFGSTGSSANAIKLNNYGSGDGENWKSYVFLSGKPDPLPFTQTNDLNQYSFYIPGL